MTCECSLAQVCAQADPADFRTAYRFEILGKRFGDTIVIRSHYEPLVPLDPRQRRRGLKPQIAIMALAAGVNSGPDTKKPHEAQFREAARPCGIQSPSSFSEHPCRHAAIILDDGGFERIDEDCIQLFR
jgi:hypothetical protein